MAAITFEILFIVLLLVANGVFAMSELAIVSARKVRLRQMCDSGDSRACAALDLAMSPERFLSTIQIGITLIGIFAGASAAQPLPSNSASRLAWCLRSRPTEKPLESGLSY